MKNLRKSRFTVEFPIPGSDGRLLALYQTMTDALALMPLEQWSSIVGDPAGGPDPPTAEALYKEGFLTPAGTDEGRLFQTWIQQYANDFSSLKSKVLVTRKCNNNCVYCIVEAEAREMSLEVARAVDRYYLGLIREKNPRDVEDQYSGGEVLLNQRVVLESASRRYYFCQGRDIDYGFSIISNGTLINPSIISRLKDVGLQGIRVSIAGPADIHDKLRPLRAGGKTYETIMKNLESVSGEIPIGIECQYDSGSNDYLRLPELIDDLMARSIAIDAITFIPIFRNRRGSPFETGMGDPSILLFLMKEAQKRGFPQFETPPRNGCLADYRSRITFDTDGSFIPCASFQSGEMTYGDVCEGMDFVAQAQILARKYPEKCLSRCELLPLCRGGCRLLSFMSDGEFNGVDCQYEVMMLVLGEYIRARADAALPRQAEEAVPGSEAAA